MSLIVQKYGGSSLDSPEKIKAVAERIVQRYRSGDRLLIVVSATGTVTDKLEKKALEISGQPDPRELDMLISVGERESISLMSMAINTFEPGLARSFTGSQIGLITDCCHGKARILEIKGDRLRSSLEGGNIPVIAGFQGVSTDKEITTLGRGGSDTTAVAVTAALGADHCEIYSDVEGVYTADPKLCPDAKLIKELDHDTMLNISSCGAKVLKDSAVEMAKRLKVTIKAGKSSTGYIGTIISDSVLNSNKFISVIVNDDLYFAAFDGSVFFTDLFENHRFYQSSEKGTLIISDRPYGKNSQKCSSVTVTGTGLLSEQKILEKIYNTVKSYSEIIAVEITNLKYEIFVKYPPPKKTADLVHNIIF